MKKYNAKLVFTLQEDAPSEVLNRPEAIARFMEDAFAINPEQESFWGNLFKQKEFPYG